MSIENPIRIKYVVGSAADLPPSQGKRIIAHVCNDIGKFGAGFSGSVSRRWKKAEEEYRAAFENTPKPRLGHTQFVRVTPRLIVANMIAMRGVRGPGHPVPLRYDALITCLERVAEIAVESHSSVHMPKLGSGLGGGNWSTIAQIIQRTLCDRGVQVVVYEWIAEEAARDVD